MFLTFLFGFVHSQQCHVPIDNRHTAALMNACKLVECTTSSLIWTAVNITMKLGIHDCSEVLEVPDCFWQIVCLCFL